MESSGLVLIARCFDINKDGEKKTHVKTFEHAHSLTHAQKRYGAAVLPGTYRALIEQGPSLLSLSSQPGGYTSNCVLQ